MSMHQQTSLRASIIRPVVYAIIAALAYRLALDISYLSVHDMYGYYGIKLNPNFVSIAESYAIILLFSTILALPRIKPSSAINSLIFFFFFCPFSSYYALSGESTLYFYLVSSCFFLLLMVPLISRKVNFTSLFEGSIFNKVLVVGVVGITVALVIAIYGVPSSLNFKSVYKLRAANVNSPAYFEYLRGWTAYVIIPGLCGLGVFYKKYLLIIAALSVNILIFMSTGAKYALFIAALAIFAAYCLKKEKQNVLFPLFLTMGIIFAVLLYQYNNSLIIGLHLIVFRPLFIPAWLSFEYFNYFTIHEFYYYAGSFSSFMQSPYNESMASLIGSSIFGSDSESWASNGMFGVAFANGGWMSMTLMTLILMIVMNIADVLYYKNKNPGFLVSMTAISNHLIHTGLTTVLFSRGMIFALFLGWLLPIAIKKLPRNLNNSKIKSNGEINANKS